MPLTVMKARAIGLMTMINAGKKDHKIILVSTSEPESVHVMKPLTCRNTVCSWFADASRTTRFLNKNPLRSKRYNQPRQLSW